VVNEAQVELVAYDPVWPDQFEAERIRLAAVLAPWLVGSIEHIGSTAVPGVAAKPVIDIAVGVRDLKSSEPARLAVLPLGYQYFPYRASEEHWFCKPSPAYRTHHLHLVPFDGTLWRERLAFRDYLREHPVVAGDYATLKRSLTEQYRFDREAYTEAKGPFIRAVLAVALPTQARPNRPPLGVAGCQQAFAANKGERIAVAFAARTHSI
jgi:GrpB-like predicted nucleotidyltransferase (UPF0157 family)